MVKQAAMCFAAHFFFFSENFKKVSTYQVAAYFSSAHIFCSTFLYFLSVIILKQAVSYFSSGCNFYRICPNFNMKSNSGRKILNYLGTEGTICMYRKSMDGLLASNTSHSMTLLQLVEYYHRKKTKMKYRSICIVLNQYHRVIISQRRLKYICKK